MADCPALTSRSLRMSYRIARGEQGVLTFEPYKSHLLPLWRFRTPTLARESSSALWTEFLRYDRQGDFVGMDMARKYIQMGMTRAKRYANYKGGRKYNKDTGIQNDKSQGHDGQVQKLESSEIFKEVWQQCRAHAGYNEKKELFMKEQKEWDRDLKRERVKKEETSEEEPETSRPTKKNIKIKEEDRSNG